MTLKKAPFLVLALALSTPLALLARGDGDAVAVAPNADQSNTSKLVYGLLSDSRYAYRPRPLDDALSQGWPVATYSRRRRGTPVNLFVDNQASCATERVVYASDGSRSRVLPYRRPSGTA